jgi:hypothetical protein
MLSLVLAAVFACSLARADDTPSTAYIGLDDSGSVTVIPADTAKFTGYFMLTGSVKGDVYTCALIAEDIGDAAPPETKLIETTLTADGVASSAHCNFSKPNGGWPVGKYRFEVYLNKALAYNVKFSVAAAKTAAN